METREIFYLTTRHNRDHTPIMGRFSKMTGF
jgi:hypothetical protein